MTYWLLSADALQIRAARALRGPAFRGRPRADAAESPPLPAPLTIANGVATINVEGVLTPTPDAEAQWYGEPNTLYGDLQASLDAAAADPAVKEIVWAVNSPGGMCDGLFALLDHIAEYRASAGAKPMRVNAEEAQSAAYGVAAAAGPITATSRMSPIGSVGVACADFVLGQMIGQVVHLTNTDAPDKRPDLSTPEGKGVVVKYLDQLGAEFMAAIAKGRGTTSAEVAAGYGRGASMLATAALAARMIDAIAARKPRTPGYTQALDTAPAPGYSPPSMAEKPSAEAQPVPADAAALQVAADNAKLIEQIVAISGGMAPAEAVALFETLQAAEARRLEAERAALVGALVELGAETPATAYAEGVLVPRLAAENLSDLTARVAALRAARPAPAAPPPVNPGGSGPSTVALEAAAKMPPEQAKRFLAMIEHRDSKAKGN